MPSIITKIIEEASLLADKPLSELRELALTNNPRERGSRAETARWTRGDCISKILSDKYVGPE